jgi:hypothetical protein
VLGLTVLTGCAGAPDLAPETAERLQEAVDGVVLAAVQGRYDDAGAALLATRTALEEAADAGQVSAARYRLIEDALRRAEVEVAALVAAEADPAEQGDPGSSDPGETGPPEHSNSGGGK